MRIINHFRFRIFVMGAGWLMSCLAANGNVPVVDLNTGQDTYQQERGRGQAAVVFPQTQGQDENVTSQKIIEDRSSPSIAPPEMSQEQRVRRLEQQMAHFVASGLVQQIHELRQEIAVLRGQIETQQHQWEVWKTGLSRDDKIAAVLKPAITVNNKVLDEGRSASVEKNLEASQYESAFTALMQKKYQIAKTGFQTYVTRYPGGVYIVNAKYWLGELFVKEGNYFKAADIFEKILEDYPNSNKCPDAQFKLAMVHEKLGLTEQAKKELLDIQKKYSGSATAQLAHIHLQQLEKSPLLGP